MKRIGLIGLGLLGSALGERMLQAGCEVLGYDVSSERRAAFAEQGGLAVDSAGQVVSTCEILALSLPDSQVVAEVVSSLTGEFRRGQVVIDTSTGEPQQVAATASRLQQLGVDYLDATILGSSAQARAGEAIVMVGAGDEPLARCRELLACFGRELFHVGPPGSGSRMKLVVNLVLGLNRAALAEGLALAGALELDPSLALEILKAGAAYSAAMDTKGAKMLSGDFSPQARLSQHLKDVRLMLASAARSGLALPLSDAHRQLLERAEAAGFGDADNSAVLRAYD